MQSRMALAKDSAAGLDPLEFDRFTRVQELTRMMAESVNDVATVQRNLQRTMEDAKTILIAQGRQARELQRDLLRTRMVEFEGIAERPYAVVPIVQRKPASRSSWTSPEAPLKWTGAGPHDPAFEHLLRNCVITASKNLTRGRRWQSQPPEPSRWICGTKATTCRWSSATTGGLNLARIR